MQLVEYSLCVFGEMVPHLFESVFEFVHLRHVFSVCHIARFVYAEGVYTIRYSDYTVNVQKYFLRLGLGKFESVEVIMAIHDFTKL